MMMLLRHLWRHIVVLLLGVVTVWLIVFVVFQVTDNTLPWILAVAVTYGLAAYVILPRAIRMGLKVLHRQHVPQYTTTGDGLPADPVNIALDNNDLEYLIYVRAGLTGIDARARSLDVLDELERTSLDYYAAIRSLYRQRRMDEIRNGGNGDAPLPNLTGELDLKDLNATVPSSH